MKNIEFANSEDGRILVIRKDGPSFLKDEIELINEMYERIEKEFPNAFQALSEHYQASRPNIPYFKYKVVRKFIRCNFGALDFTTHDIDEHENFNFEKVDCPCRGECPLENIVCSPIFATGLSRREEEIVKVACSNGGTAEDIAKVMSVSVHTVRCHQNTIMKKLGLHSFKDVIRWWETKGYISDQR